MIKLFPVLYLFVTSSVFAQVATSSLFGELRNDNPAVISSRVAGQMTFNASN